MSEKKGKAIWDLKIVRGAIWESILKLNPRKMMGNPVMFVVEVGSVLTSVLLVRDVLGHQRHVRLQPADHALAVVYRAVRQFRGSHGGRSRQSPGRVAAQSPV